MPRPFCRGRRCGGCPFCVCSRPSDHILQLQLPSGVRVAHAGAPPKSALASCATGRWHSCLPSPRQGYSDVAYTNAGCDDQLGPQNTLGAVVRAPACWGGRALPPTLPPSCAAPYQAGLAVRVFLPDTLTSAKLWSVTNISIPLKRTSVSTAATATLSNYELVFYGPWLRTGRARRVRCNPPPPSAAFPRSRQRRPGAADRRGCRDALRERRLRAVLGRQPERVLPAARAEALHGEL